MPQLGEQPVYTDPTDPANQVDPATYGNGGNVMPDAPPTPAPAAQLGSSAGYVQPQPAAPQLQMDPMQAPTVPTAAPQYPVAHPDIIDPSLAQSAAETANLQGKAQETAGQKGEIDLKEQEDLAKKQDELANEKKQQAHDYENQLITSRARMDQMGIQAQKAYQEYSKAAKASGGSPSDQFWANKGTGARILAFVAAAGAGFANGISGHGGGANPVLAHINEEIRQNYDANRAHVEDLYKSQVEAGKLVDSAQSRADFDQKAKAAYYEIASQHIVPEMESIKANATGRTQKLIADQAIQGLEAQKIATREGLSKDEATKAAASQALFRSQTKEAGEKYQALVQHFTSDAGGNLSGAAARNQAYKTIKSSNAYPANVMANFGSNGGGKAAVIAPWEPTVTPNSSPNAGGVYTPTPAEAKAAAKAAPAKGGQVAPVKGGQVTPVPTPSMEQVPTPTLNMHPPPPNPLGKFSSLETPASPTMGATEMQGGGPVRTSPPISVADESTPTVAPPEPVPSDEKPDENGWVPEKEEPGVTAPVNPAIPTKTAGGRTIKPAEQEKENELIVRTPTGSRLANSTADKAWIEKATESNDALQNYIGVVEPLLDKYDLYRTGLGLESTDTEPGKYLITEKELGAWEAAADRAEKATQAQVDEGKSNSSVSPRSLIAEALSLVRKDERYISRPSWNPVAGATEQDINGKLQEFRKLIKHNNVEIESRLRPLPAEAAPAASPRPGDPNFMGPVNETKSAPAKQAAKPAPARPIFGTPYVPK